MVKLILNQNNSYIKTAYICSAVFCINTAILLDICNKFIRLNYDKILNNLRLLSLNSML